MYDIENNRIKLQSKRSGHILIVGDSGSGKTFACCRMVEQAIRNGLAPLIFDYSGSYTYEQLGKNLYSQWSRTKILDIKKGAIEWKSHFATRKDWGGAIAHSIISTLGIKAYYQKKWLKKAIEMYLESHEKFSFLQFVVSLDKLYETKKMEDLDEVSSDDLKNLEHLLSRLEPYEDIKQFEFVYCKEPIKRTGATLLQISNIPEQEKRFLVSIVLEMMWQELKINGGKSPFDFLVLDEFQFLSLKEGSTLCNLLRESRRFGLSLILSTQFITNYKKSELDAIFQVEHVFVFKPSKKGEGYWAKFIDANNHQKWQSVLVDLKVGSAVLKGNYSVNNSEKTFDQPIICKITR